MFLSPKECYGTLRKKLNKKSRLLVTSDELVKRGQKTKRARGKNFGPVRPARSKTQCPNGDWCEQESSVQYSTTTT